MMFVAGVLLSGCDTQAHRAIAEMLRDPSSARFSHEVHSKDGSLCGSVDGKNGFGAYSGASPYVYSDGTVNIYGDNLKGTNIDTLLSSYSSKEEFSEISQKIRSDCEFVAAWKQHCSVGASIFEDKEAFCATFRKPYSEWHTIADRQGRY
jgi:hypothetical protein